MSVKALQEKIGVTADGAFGPGTLKAAMNFYKMTPERAAHFFAQTGHETGEFKLFTENLNYSADGLKKIFGKYFPGDTANSYARNPEKIANKVYGNRMGNGAEASGEGYKFRGRGALQLTGKSNYEAFSTYLSKPDVMTTPDLVASTYAFESAQFFFDRNKLWAICDKGVNDAAIKELTKRINGGFNGLEHRIELTKKYYGWLKS
jgi:putative chitinase